MTKSTTRLTLVVFAAITSATFAQTHPTSAPASDAVSTFRAYVDALRTGDANRAMSFVETVPASSHALVEAGVKMNVAVEQVKSEMTRQMGPPKLEEDGWNMGQMPDEILKGLHEKKKDEQTVMLAGVDPRPASHGDEFAVAWAVKRDGVWRIPAGLITDGEPGTPYVEPDATMRAQMIKQFDATSRAAGVVLTRLKSKTYKTPADVQSALGDEMARAGAL